MGALERRVVPGPRPIEARRRPGLPLLLQGAIVLVNVVDCHPAWRWAGWMQGHHLLAGRVVYAVMMDV